MFFISPAYATWDRVPTNINKTTYSQNLHAVRNHDALLRIGSTIFALTPYHSTQEALWKSTDEGATWTLWWNSFTNRASSLMRGANDQLYLFYRSGVNIFMLKYEVDNITPPTPVVISTTGETNYGAYFMLSSTVDEAGRLYVFWHEPDDVISGSDQISMVISADEGATWGTKQIVMAADSDDGWYNAHAAVSADDQLYVTLSSFQDNPREVRVLRSDDHGDTWAGNSLLYSGVMTNPHIITKGNNDVWVFTQCEDDLSPSPGRGLQGIWSTDSGATWGSWQLIDRSCNYADPTAAITSTGGIVIAYRNDHELGVIGTPCGESCYHTIITSDDDGSTWIERQWLNTMEQTGTRSRLRYQTWHTGGGVLEWSWMNYDDGGTATPIFYSQNSDITIASQAETNPTVTVTSSLTTESSPATLSVSAIPIDGETILSVTWINSTTNSSGSLSSLGGTEWSGTVPVVKDGNEMSITITQSDFASTVIYRTISYTLSTKSVSGESSCFFSGLVH